MIQGIQMAHAPRAPHLLTGNTFEAIDRMIAEGILEPKHADELLADYTFLRRIEHFLQLYEDRQIHTLPDDPEERELLARRLGDTRVTGPDFFRKIEEVRARVRSRYELFLETGRAGSVSD